MQPFHVNLKYLQSQFKRMLSEQMTSSKAVVTDGHLAPTPGFSNFLLHAYFSSFLDTIATYISILVQFSFWPVLTPYN